MKTIELQFMRPDDRFKPAAGHRPAVSPANGNEPAAGFWPEVSSPNALQNPPPTNPENSPQRVLFEVFLVLAAGLLMIAAVMVLGSRMS